MGEDRETLSREYGRVFAFFRRRTGDADRAADLTQEVFLGAARALRNGRAHVPPEALLFQIAERRFIDYARRQKRHAPAIPLDLAPEVAAPARYPISVARALRRALGRLPPESRQILVWKLIEGRSFREIGERAGASEPACRMRFRRGLAALRTELEKEGIGDENG